MNPKVSIIIVNWNGRKHLEECFSSLYAQSYLDFEAIFVDNGSTDSSVEFVTDNYPQVKVIKLKENTGFAKGNNVGIREAFKNDKIKYIFTLNNDTKIDKNCLHELISMAEEKKEFDMWSCKILFYDKPEVINSLGIFVKKYGSAIDVCFMKPNQKNNFLLQEVFGPCACGALYRRGLLEKIGLFNESYFAYFEDVDLAWRARFAGAKCLYNPKAIIYHKHSATGAYLHLLKVYYLQRNKLFNIIKYYPAKYLFQALAAHFLRLIPTASKLQKMPNDSYFKKHSKIAQIRIYAKAHWDVLKILPKLISQRKKLQSEKIITDEEIAFWLEHEIIPYE